MASTSTILMAVPMTQKKAVVSHAAFFKPLISPSPRTGATTRYSKGRRARAVKVQASVSMKEKAITGLTAAALAAAFIVPEMAEAAQPGFSPSLRNFILSIVSGGVVLTLLFGAVVGVSNFDPVKRS